MTEQSPDPTGVEQTTTTGYIPAADTSAPAPADTSSTPAPADTSSTPAPADTSSTPAPADTSSSSAKAGDLCSFTTEDGDGFATLHNCLVLEVFTEPDDAGDERQLARVAILPDERIVDLDRLENRS